MTAIMVCEDQRDRQSNMKERKSIAWLPEEDALLLQERRRNTKWPAIALLFRDKSANACRKRYERLAEIQDRMRTTRKISNEKLGRAYKMHRERFWREIAKEIDLDHDRWEMVESTAFSWGLGQLNIFDRRSRKDSDVSVIGRFGSLNTTPDSDDSDSIFSDSTNGGTGPSLPRPHIQSSHASFATYASPKFAAFPWPPAAVEPLSGTATSSNGAHHGPFSAHCNQSQSQPNLHALNEGSIRIGKSRAVKQSRNDLRLPEPTYNLRTSHSPDLSQHQRRSSHFSRILHTTTDPAQHSYHHYASLSSSLTPNNAATKPGSIDSMLQGSSSSSPRFQV